MNNEINQSNFSLKKFKHDLKNPINAMIGYSEYIVEEIETDEYIVHINDINTIHKSCKNINEQIEKSLILEDNEVVLVTDFQYLMRSSLCSIIGLIEIIKDKSTEENFVNNEEFDECVTNIYDSCKNMLNIIDNIQIYFEEKEISSNIPNIDTSIDKKTFTYTYEKVDTVKYEGRILIIDDDAINSQLMKKILEKLNHAVCIANNANDALEFINNEKFDIILLDIIMPDINGIELLQKIKKNNNYYDTPIIMLSALDDLNAIVDCINLGAADYITKPVDKILLNARINSCLEKKEYRDNEKKYLNRIKEEEKKSNDLLLNIMPAGIADRLKQGENNIADRFEDVTVLFADISGFTRYASNISPKIIVKELNNIFSVFDDLVDKYNAEKIKTIGDNYMIASGIPFANKMHAETIIDLAIAMNNAIPTINKNLGIKIGVSSGEVVAGVIGKRKFIYDLWGDTVNVASRMERYGGENKIHVSDSTYQLVKNKYKFIKRDPIDVKGKGQMDTYYLK